MATGSKKVAISNLKPGHQRFVDEYLIDFNGTQAAIRAGYSETSARSTAAELLTYPDIQTEISNRVQKQSEKLGITAERILLEASRIAFANIEDLLRIGEDGTAFIDLSKATREQMAAVSVVETEEKLERTGRGRDDFENIRKIKLRMNDKLAALTLLARHQKLLTDNLVVDGDLKLEVEDVKDKLRARLLRGSAPQPAAE
jgi:phage terminase small subunit